MKCRTCDGQLSGSTHLNFSRTAIILVVIVQHLSNTNHAIFNYITQWSTKINTMIYKNKVGEKEKRCHALEGDTLCM